MYVCYGSVGHDEGSLCKCVFCTVLEELSGTSHNAGKLTWTTLIDARLTLIEAAFDWGGEQRCLNQEV